MFKKLLLIIILIVVFMFTSCSIKTGYSNEKKENPIPQKQTENIKSKNILRKSAFSKSEYNILNKLSLLDKVKHFKYTGEKKTIGLYTECYKKGIPEQKIYTTDFDLENGKEIFYLIENLENFLKISFDGSSYHFEVDHYSASCSSVNENTINIDKEKEFILYAQIMSKSNTIPNVSDNIFTNFAEEKDALLKNDFVILFKGKVKE